MKPKPNLDAFLAGGQAAAAEIDVSPAKAAATPAAAPPAPASAKAPLPPEAPTMAVGEIRITKTIRMDKRFDLALKQEVLRLATQGGPRVTESDLIEEALKLYLKL